MVRDSSNGSYPDKHASFDDESLSFEDDVDSVVEQLVEDERTSFDDEDFAHASDIFDRDERSTRLRAMRIIMAQPGSEAVLP